MAVGNRFGWHSGCLYAKDAQLKGDLYVQDDIIFSDVSAGVLGVTGGIQIGTSSSAVNLGTTATNKAVVIYTTSASTTGGTSVEPFYFESTMSGAGGVGGRARFHLSATGALGDWANALKASATFGASGKVTGLGSCACTDLTLSAGTTSGWYTCYEANIVAESGASTGSGTAFFHLNAAGALADTIDGAAYFMRLGANLDAASGKFVDTDKTAESAYGGMRVEIEGIGTKYIRLFDAA